MHKKIITDKSSLYEREKRLCYREGEPQPDVLPTEDGKPDKHHPRNRSADKKRTREKRTREEKRSGAKDAKELQIIEREIELSTYLELQQDFKKLQDGGKVDLEKIVKAMQSIADSPDAPRAFSKISVAKLAIMERDDVTQLLSDIRDNIEKLRDLKRNGEFAELQEAFMEGLPVTNISLVLRPSSDSNRIYNPEGKPMTALKVTKESTLPVQSVAVIDGLTWYKLGKPVGEPSPFSDEFVYRTSEASELTQNLSKDNLRHLIVRYETILARMKHHRGGARDIRQTADLIKSLRRFLVEVISGEEDLSDNEIESYTGVLRSLKYAGNLPFASLGDIAIMERADFDAFIGAIDARRDALIKMLDEKIDK